MIEKLAPVLYSKANFLPLSQPAAFIQFDTPMFKFEVSIDQLDYKFFPRSASFKTFENFQYAVLLVKNADFCSFFNLVIVLCSVIVLHLLLL